MSRQTFPGTIPATADNIIKAQATLWLACTNCDHEKTADLSAIISSGRGKVPVIELKFKCSACGSIKIDKRLSNPSADRFRRPA